MRAKHIVGEVTVNWPQPDGTLVPHVKDGLSGIISNRFENLIAYNETRGYALASWQLHQVCPDSDHMTETIVAVFVATSEKARETYD